MLYICNHTYILMHEKLHSNNGKAVAPDVEVEDGSNTVLTSLYLEKDQREWIKNRKLHGESASTVVRTLIRRAMEAQAASAQTA
jgi:hypothetical protein